MHCSQKSQLFALSFDGPIRTKAPSTSLACLPTSIPAQRGQVLFLVPQFPTPLQVLNLVLKDFAGVMQKKGWSRRLTWLLFSPRTLLGHEETGPPLPHPTVSTEAVGCSSSPSQQEPASETPVPGSDYERMKVFLLRFPLAFILCTGS